MIKIACHKLANGLEVVHSRNAISGMAAVNVLYKVGSRNESPQYTGLAHFLEHLMFTGSENARNFDTCMQEAGGENNAWTNNDITNYYEVLPVQNIETAFWLEADRMQNLLLSDKAVETQRSVVQEEFKQRCLNVPYGDVGHVLRALVYKQSSYRWPVIGKSLSDIEDVPKAVIRDFYTSHYAPNNAILSIVGNVDAEKVFELAHKWFGNMCSRKMANDDVPEEPKQMEARTAHILKDVPYSLLVKAYRMCGRLGTDYVACDLISDLLSNGRSSRLFRNVYAKGGLVSSIDASITGDLADGMFVIKAQLLPGVGFEKAEKAITDELERLLQDGADAMELEKAANRFESNLLFGNLNNDERAYNLAYYQMLGNAEGINMEAERYRSITSSQVLEIGRRLFRPENSSTLYYESNRK